MNTVFQPTLKSIFKEITRDIFDGGLGMDYDTTYTKPIWLPLITDLYGLGLSPDATFARNSAATITLHDGSVQTCLPNEARFQGARRVQNLATGVVTETVTVEQNKHYLVCIKGDDGTTAVCSGAFSETVTADGANRITFPNGTALQATTASLTVTVTGTLEQLQVEVAD